MSKKHKHKIAPLPKKQSFLAKLFRFFVPKDFKAELRKGMDIGSGTKAAQMLHGGLYGAGKKARRMVDPGHKMRFK